MPYIDIIALMASQLLNKSLLAERGWDTASRVAIEDAVRLHGDVLKAHIATSYETR